MVGKKRCFVMQSLLQLSPMPSAAAPAKVSCSRAYARYSEARIEAGRDCGGKQDEETELRAQMLDVRLFMQYDGMISVYTVPEKVVELSLPSMIDDWRRLATIGDDWRRNLSAAQRRREYSLQSPSTCSNLLTPISFMHVV